jgi:N-acetylglucosamine-6-phosphate deacetylase
MRTILNNGTIITPIRIIKQGCIVIEKNSIVNIFKDSNDVRFNESDKIIDVRGHYITPGFIDIHTHGGFGYDYLDGSVESIINASEGHLKYGTTSLVPTISSAPLEQIIRVLDCFKEAKLKNANGPDLLGVHLEGPYFSFEEKGAQDPNIIRKPEKEEYMKILNHSNDIVRWSIAPEIEGALELGRMLTEKGILCSAGHTNAFYEDMLEAYENGFTHITHLYSSTSMLKRINAFRYPGVVESAYLIDEMTVEIIADGKHLPASLLKLIYKIKGPDKICLVTDSIRAAGLPEGEYTRPDGRKFIVEDGVAKLRNRTSFAGSIATADRLLKTMVNDAGISLQDSIKMFTLTPARIMRVDNNKGLLASGKDADIVVFDNNLNIKLVMVKGNIRFHSN